MHEPDAAEHGVVVVRLGSLATDLSPWRDRVASEIAELRRRGRPVVVVHGGGARVDAALAQLGKRPAFVEGRAAPDAASFQAAEMAALAAGKDLASAVQRFGANALGLSGRDAGVVAARPAHGSAGEVATVRASPLRELLADGFLPILAAIGADDRGGGVLLKPDDAAARIAAALGASLLVILDLDDGVEVHGKRAAVLGSARAALLVNQGEVAGPLAATLAACARAVEQGVGGARIVDVRLPAGLLRAAAGEDVGTLVVAQDVRAAARAAMGSA
ncbi:MAG TPA: hypothetical protein VGR28_13105 [Candidatus Thermoplasmatota archaeon]|jgi:acetylglutamate kinase|nr:hypothetical protein [Candidatus Thermoplasmatota archaeon]